MIPSLAISQKRYIINSDTIVGYSPSENRAIALLFIKGEMHEDLYLNQLDITNHKDSIIELQKYTILVKDSTLVVQTKLLRTIDTDLRHSQEAVEAYKKSNKNKIVTIMGSIALNIVLLFTLIIK